MAEFPNPEVLFVPKEVNPTWSQAEARPLMREWELATLQLPGAKPTAAIAVSNGTIIPSQAHHLVDTEGQAATDELDTIAVSGVHDGCVLYLYGADAGRVITVRHNPNQVNGVALAGGADKALSATAFMRLKREGDYWRELADGSVAASLSDALDGDRRAADGIGASEWALAQAYAWAEEARKTAALASPLGDIQLKPFRPEDLATSCPGWHFCNGDRYILSSPVGQALNALPANLKADFGIVVSDGNISIPNMFYIDGRGLFLRAVDGTTRQVGNVEGDAIRDMAGYFRCVNGPVFEGLPDNGLFTSVGYESGRHQFEKSSSSYRQVNFKASNIVPTGPENTVLNIGMTPVIFLGV